MLPLAPVFDDTPGVSTSSTSRNDPWGMNTSRWVTVLTGTGSFAGIRRSSIGTGTVSPDLVWATMCSERPYRNRATTCVHSPASVGATRCPISALSRVDFPDDTRPAIAIVGGSSARRYTPASWVAIAGGRPWPVSARVCATSWVGPVLTGVVTPPRPLPGKRRR